MILCVVAFVKVHRSSEGACQEEHANIIQATMVSLGHYVINCWSTYFLSKFSSASSTVAALKTVSKPQPKTGGGSDKSGGCFRTLTKSLVNRARSTRRRSRKKRGKLKCCPRCQELYYRDLEDMTSADVSPHGITDDYHTNCTKYWRYGFEAAVYHVSNVYYALTSYSEFLQL